MNEFFKILLTSGLTIIGGITIFALTKVIERFQVDPIIELNNLRGEIATYLIINANKFGYPKVNGEELKTLSFDLRNLSAKLRGTVFKISFYNFYFRLGLIPKRIDVINASSSMIGLSNTISSPDFDQINKYERKIEKLLKLNLD
ncbi:hypothetical protein [Marinoscillum pacificum]|uniref:hypothetical protein n=1 Tax=Marinoscillum pacificum TaxID=392723 RepID=UPI002157C172|nr:hypothetical protein [Marinoscillum pacificum]